MLFIILTILSLVGFTYLLRVGEGDWGFAVACFFVVFVTTMSIQAGNGFTDYPYFVKEKAEINTVEKNVDLIRSSRYECTASPRAILNGSIENMKQSTILSEYISKLIEKKANYNSELINSKFYKDYALYWFVGGGIFISDKVLELELLE